MSEVATVAKSKVLACIDSSPHGERVCRQANKLARELNARWTAVHVSTPADDRASKQVREQLLKTFRLAQELGAETVSLNDEDVAGEVLTYAKAEGVTHIVVGAPSGPWPFEIFGRSPVRRLMRRVGDIALQICPRSQRPLAEAASEAIASAPWGNVGAYIVATGFVALATSIAVPIQRATALPNISLIYVLAVIAASIRYGGVVSAFTAVASALAYNFFMTQPYYSFTIYDPINVSAVAFFLAVAISVSALAAHARAQTALARRQAREALELRLLTQTLVDARDKVEIVRVAADVASRVLQARAVVMFKQDGLLEMAAEAPGSEVLGGGDLAAARWVFEHGREAGRGSDTLETARWLFTPVRGDHGVVAVLGVRPFDEASSLGPEQRRHLDLIANQVGLALDRSGFAQDASHARVDMERARAISMLLASSLKAHASDPTINRLISTVDANTEIHVEVEPVTVVELVDAAIERVRDNLGERFVSRDVRSNLPTISVDRALTEDALMNVIQEVARGSSEKSTILVRAQPRGQTVVIEVLGDETAQAFSTEGAATPVSMRIVGKFLAAEGASLEAAERGARMLFPPGRARSSHGLDSVPARVS